MQKIADKRIKLRSRKEKGQESIIIRYHAEYENFKAFDDLRENVSKVFQN